MTEQDIWDRIRNAAYFDRYAEVDDKELRIRIATARVWAAVLKEMRK